MRENFKEVSLDMWERQKHTLIYAHFITEKVVNSNLNSVAERWGVDFASCDRYHEFS
ncbi:MAG: hypothetical protein F6K10_39920 [Moorea sp. SIO2B7]|nr:hypothetical protein [Moorena sp. SIO2B7]